MSKKNGKDEILVPIDFTEQSLIALGQSYNLAKEYNAELVLLYVIDDSNVIPSFMTSKQQTEMKKNIQKKLDGLAADIEKKTGVLVDTMIAKGKPYDKIIEVAEMLGAIMIIMGHNSRKKIHTRFIGSNALRV